MSLYESTWVYNSTAHNPSCYSVMSTIVILVLFMQKISMTWSNLMFGKMEGKGKDERKSKKRKRWVAFPHVVWFVSEKKELWCQPYVQISLLSHFSPTGTKKKMMGLIENHYLPQFLSNNQTTNFSYSHIFFNLSSFPSIFPPAKYSVKI